MRLITLHCFFLTLISVSYMFSAIYPYLSLLLSYFEFLFSPFYFASFIGTHMCRSLSFNRSATLLQKLLQPRCFLMNFWRTRFLQNTSRRQLLSIAIICQEHLKLNVIRTRATIFWPLTSSLYTICLVLYLHDQTVRKNTAKPYQCISNYKVKLLTFFIWLREASENIFEVKI